RPPTSPADFDVCGASAIDVSAGGGVPPGLARPPHRPPPPRPPPPPPRAAGGAPARAPPPRRAPAAARPPPPPAAPLRRAGRPPPAEPDVAFRRVLPATRDVTLGARTFTAVLPGLSGGAWPRPHLALVRDCADMSTTVDCDPGVALDERTHDTVLRERMLPAGTYWVILEPPSVPSYAAPSVAWELTVGLRDPTSPPPTDVCGASTTTVTASTTIEGVFSEEVDDYELVCHPGAFRDGAVKLVL